MNLQTAIDMALGRPGAPFHTGHLHSGTPLVKLRQILGCEGMSREEILKDLRQMQADGYTAIPAEGCDNHEGGHCKGHETPRKVGPAAGALHK